MLERNFGFDLDNIEKVMKYVLENYKKGEDFEMWIGYGDDVMNCLEIKNNKMMEDKKLMELINECEECVE